MTTGKMATCLITAISNGNWSNGNLSIDNLSYRGLCFAILPAPSILFNLAGTETR